MKKVNVKKNKMIFFSVEIFTPYASKYNVINFALSNNDLWQISFLQPIWNDF